MVSVAACPHRGQVIVERNRKAAAPIPGVPLIAAVFPIAALDVVDAIDGPDSHDALGVLVAELVFYAQTPLTLLPALEAAP